MAYDFYALFQAKTKHQLQIKNVPVGVVPSDLQEWSTYEVPDEVLQAFKNELMAKTIGDFY